MKTFTKRKGVTGALLDEYEYSIEDLKNSLRDIDSDELIKTADSQTLNKDCVSIQSVLTHIILCGYNYITMIDIHRGNKDSKWPVRIYYDNIPEYFSALDEMLKHNVKYFEKITQAEIYQYDPKKKIVAGWGQIFDIEQLMEHAIVHIYRHRRQIEKFKEILRGK